MTLKTLISGQNSWGIDSSWSPAGTPEAQDDVLLGDGNVVNLIGAATTIRSLGFTAASARLQLTFGTLTVTSGINLTTGTLVAQGTIANCALNLAGGALIGAPALDNVTMTGTLDMSALGAIYPTLFVQNTLTLASPGQIGILATAPNASIQVSTQTIFGGVPATIDGGIVKAGSPLASSSVFLTSRNNQLTLGAGLALDVVGAVTILGGAGSALGPVIDKAATSIAAGGSLVLIGGVTLSGDTHISSGTEDASLLNNPGANLGNVYFDDAAGKLIMGATQSVTVRGFRAGDTIDVKNTANLRGPLAIGADGALHLGSASIVLAGPTLPGATYTAASDGSFGTLITTTAGPAAAVAFADASSGAAGTHALDAVSDGPSYLQWRYIDSGPDTVSIADTAANAFIKGGSGTKAISVDSGRNVLDGGTGSAFLTGGSGADTFFLDLRNPTPVWDTLLNFHAGDAVTVWGWQPGSTRLAIDPIDGAPGAQGATLRFTDASGTVLGRATFAGFSAAQAASLQQAAGTQAAGSYIYFYNPGV